MKLKEILEKIKEKYSTDNDIQFLVNRMERGDLSARKQLADMVSGKPALLPPLMHHEIGKWGITDDLSQVKEVKNTRGGARPGAGRPPVSEPRSYIQMQVPRKVKATFVRAAQRSPEGNLTQWMIAAAKEKIERER